MSIIDFAIKLSKVIIGWFSFKWDEGMRRVFGHVWAQSFLTRSSELSRIWSHTHSTTLNCIVCLLWSFSITLCVFSFARIFLDFSFVFACVFVSQDFRVLCRIIFININFFFSSSFAAYDLATQCESRRSSIRRHTIVGCQSFKAGESHSVPPSRPQSRQSTDQSQQQPPPSMTSSVKSTTPQVNPPTNLNAMDTWSKNSLDEHQWRDKLETTERLSLTLEEIVHIRSVITKAELESLPVGIHIKEDVEKRKLCFLCLRTKFGILSSRGVPCKLCQRTVCAKCYTKMRIPTEHFSNVPVQLLSPSLQNSPTVSNAPSPSHHGGIDESFPRSLMERLLRTDVDRKVKKIANNFASKFSW